MALIHIDPNTLNIKVSTEIDKPFVPDEETIAIKLMAKQLRDYRDEFIQKNFNPKVDQLMELVMKYNAKSDPKVAKSLVELQERKRKALEEQMKPKEKKATTSKLTVTEKKKASRAKPKSRGRKKKDH